MLFLTWAVSSPVFAGDRVPVLSITHDRVTQVTQEEVCWDVIVSDRERAQRQYEQQPWLLKYWKPILGGVLGGAAAYQSTANYGAAHQKWVYPTTLGGVAVGALAGPGAVIGGYGLGTLAYSHWPGKLPLVAAVSLVGGILGDLVFNGLFPDQPDASLLAAPQPGRYLADQRFYVETSCLPRPRVRHAESAYRVAYDYRGQRRTAVLQHYPGDMIELDAGGRPVHALASP